MACRSSMWMFGFPHSFPPMATRAVGRARKPSAGCVLLVVQRPNSRYCHTRAGRDSSRLRRELTRPARCYLLKSKWRCSGLENTAKSFLSTSAAVSPAEFIRAEFQRGSRAFTTLLINTSNDVAAQCSGVSRPWLGSPFRVPMSAVLSLFCIRV